ncbi:hypothetical protein F511_46213 [Dorcoceras hygrometricum]|uniref:Uncharacterized protein n=1 Tax=Dorcoceras hygrometricum TaxID=472368 RepID=A0A2Z7A1I4_9LAMI|nr:hypothetical protein F511_46213 [Dorcoceras hygrometricum]
MLRGGRVIGARPCAVSGETMREKLRPCVAFCAVIFRGGGLRPAAAPAMIRRCRDGWSEFF